jgi:hypothetical protein
MNPNPSHLGLKYAEQFKDLSLVAVYHYRRPCPDEAINKLVALVTDEPRTILDLRYNRHRCKEQKGQL